MKESIPFAQRIKLGKKYKSSNLSNNVKLNELERNILELQEKYNDDSQITDSIVVEKDESGNPCRYSSILAVTEKIDPLKEEYLPKTGSSFSLAIRKRNFSSNFEPQKFQTKKQKIDDAINNYIPNSAIKLPFYCRVCQTQFSNHEEFQSHRSSDVHKEKDAFLRRASYCHQCRKQFTSPEQLKEHRKGKSHLERRNRTNR